MHLLVNHYEFTVDYISCMIGMKQARYARHANLYLLIKELAFFQVIWRIARVELGIAVTVVKQVKLDISLYSFFHAVEDVLALAKSIDGPLAHEIDLGFGTLK